MFPSESSDLSVALDFEACARTERIHDLDAQIKSLTKQRDAERQAIQLALGDAELGVLPGGGAWSWKTVERREHMVKASSARQLKFKGAKGAVGDET